MTKRNITILILSILIGFFGMQYSPVFAQNVKELIGEAPILRKAPRYELPVLPDGETPRYQILTQFKDYYVMSFEFVLYNVGTSSVSTGCISIDSGEVFCGTYSIIPIDNYEPRY